MNLELIVLPETFAICRLDPNVPIPHWANGEFVSITRTPDELSIVCGQDHVPDGVQCESDWRCLRVAGELDFSLVGVIATLTKVLADAGISVFVISTFDTDYILLSKVDVDRAVMALEKAGYSVRNQ
jgi:hypothetical protein